MVSQPILEKISDAAGNYRLGLAAAGSEALVGITEVLITEMVHWTETEIIDFQSLLEKLLQAQEQKNILYIADILEYQILPNISGLNILNEKGDQG